LVVSLLILVSTARVAGLANRYNSHILLVLLILLDLLILFTQMSGDLHLLLPREVTVTMSFSLMTILDTLGSIL